jgi:hypothetical protein
MMLRLAFIKRYGDTFYATLARARLEDLKKQQVAVTTAPEAEAKRHVDAASAKEKDAEQALAKNQANQQQLLVDAERRRQEAKDAAQRQANLDAELPRKEEVERVAALDAARRQTDAEAAAGAKRKADEQVRIATATLNAEERATFIRRVQTLLKQGHCYDGAINGRSGDTQDGLDRFIAGADRKGKEKHVRIELAKATASDFDAWLRDADTLKGDICAPAVKRILKAAPEERAPNRAPSQARAPSSQPRSSYPPSNNGGGGAIQGVR